MLYECEGLISDFDCTGFPTKVYSEEQKAKVSPDYIISLHSGFLHCVLLVKYNRINEVIFFDATPKKNVLALVYRNEVRLIGEVSEERITKSLKQLDLMFLNYSFKDEYKSKKAMLCIRSQRLGDFIAQVNWLARLLSKVGLNQVLDVYDCILIDLDQAFFDIREIFPELKSKIIIVNDCYSYALKHNAKKIIFANAMPNSRTNNFIFLKNRFKLAYHPKSVKKNDNKFILIISFDLEKRKWTNQKAVILRAINYLLSNGLRVKVLINGMTGSVTGENGKIQHIIDEEKKMVVNLFENSFVELEDMSGKSLKEKYISFSSADFFIAPIGSATVLPSLLLDLEGMALGNKSMITSKFFLGFVAKETWVPDVEEIEDVTEVNGMIKWVIERETVSYMIKETYFIDSYINQLSKLARFR